MQIRYFFELIGLAALWGASFLFLRIAVPELGPIWLIEWRVLIAGLFLLPLILKPEYIQQLKKYAWPLFITGGINSALPFVGYAYATTALTGGVTSILNATVPLFGVLLIMLGINKETLTRAQLGGFVLGFAGVGILLGWHDMGVAPHFWLAVLAGLGGSLLYAFSANYIKNNLQGVAAPVIATGTLLAAAIWLLPLLPFSAPTQWPSLKAIGATIGLAVFSTAAAYLLYFRLIRLLGAAKAVTVTYMIPLFAMLWGSIWLAEPITLDMIIGCIVILTGTAMANGVLQRLRPKK